MLKLCIELKLKIASYLDPCTYVDLAKCHDSFHFLINGRLEWKRLVKRSRMGPRLIEKLVEFMAIQDDYFCINQIMTIICQQNIGDYQLLVFQDFHKVDLFGVRLLCYTMEIVRFKSEKTYCKLNRCLYFVSGTNLFNLDCEEDGEGGEDGDGPIEWFILEKVFKRSSIITK